MKKFPLKNYSLATFFLLASLSTSSGQDPVKAGDDAYSMGVYYSQRGFNMLPAIDGVDGRGAKIEFLIPVTQGIDYVFLAGRDKFIQDLDIYIYDEGNGLIIKDRRSDARAGTRFRASYTGRVKVILHVARANGLGGWSVIVGRRGGGASIPVAAPGAKLQPKEDNAPAE
jgi:hypothetical protein